MLGKIEVGMRRDDRGWDGWMASSTWWKCVWARSRSWWWTGNPGMLQSMGLQRAGHDWATELNWKSFPGGVSSKESTCQYRRHRRYRSDPWVGQILWRRKWQCTPVFLPGESRGQRSLAGLVHRVTQSLTRLKRLSTQRGKTSEYWKDSLFNK